MLNSNYKILILFLFTIFSSCGLPYCRKTHLNDDELAWMEKFNRNDTVCLYGVDFVDTLYVTNKRVYNKNFISNLT